MSGRTEPTRGTAETGVLNSYCTRIELYGTRVFVESSGRMRPAPSFVAGLLVGGLLACLPLRPRRSVTRARTITDARTVTVRSRRPVAVPEAGDLASPGALASVLARRASAEGEIIFMLTDAHHVRLALNLLLNLDELGLRHHLVIASSPSVCAQLAARAHPIGVSLGCGHSSFLRRGEDARIDVGLDAYAIDDQHVYHLWWQRWYFLSEAVGLGYRVLSLDTDVSLRADPYPLLHGALAHHSLLTGLDTDQYLRPFYFPAANVGFVYARGPPGGAAHWVLSEARRRLERLLRGEVVALPAIRGRSQQVVWDQDTFKDVLETAAFTPNAPSYRHAQMHCYGRHTRISPGRLAPDLPAHWHLQIERLRFFANASIPPLPSAWLPLHLPPTSQPHPSAEPPHTAQASSQQWLVDAARGSCNGSVSAGGSAEPPLWDLWQPSDRARAVGGAATNGTFGAVPLWLFASYMLCPHGGVCDGRWGWRPPPYLIGHLVGVKAKFWILRLLGWWHYDAARAPQRDRGPLGAASGSGAAAKAAPPADQPNEKQAAAADGPGGDHASSAPQAGGQRRGYATVGSNHERSAPPRPSELRRRTSATLPPVFPPSQVRPLVLRGHALRLGSRENDVRALQRRLVHWALLATALGRTAIVPLVPCTIPTPEVPVDLRNRVVLIKLAQPAWCDARARTPSWHITPAEERPLSSHERLRVTAEMSAFRDYKGVMSWPPKRAASCCQLLPEIRCIDRYGESSELRDELMLSERDLSWLLEHSGDAAEEGNEQNAVDEAGEAGAAGTIASTTVVRPEGGRQLTLETLRAYRDARTLIINLQAEDGVGAAAAAAAAREAGQQDDPLALLPSLGEVEKAVQRALRRGKAGGVEQGASTAEPTWLDRHPGSQRCLQRLLAISREALPT